MSTDKDRLSHLVDSRLAAKYFRASYRELAVSVDRMMLVLLGAEWLGLMATAFISSARTWNGTQSSLHLHLIAAVLSGPAFILPVMAIALLRPGSRLTRHAVAAAQMLVSVLLIDVTGGRIETHFHVFGSLSFLAWYRDWPVLITASAITAVDHIVRGVWWPQSVYGVATVSAWRWVEHAWWVSFEDFFLILAVRRSIREMWAVADAKAHLHDDARHDVLTGLANRRWLMEQFASKLASAPPARMAVLFIDLDRFKQANDTLGHAVGDRLLALVAARLRQEVAGENTLARIGGDEFIVLLNDVRDGGEANTVGLRLLRSLSEPFLVDNHELLLSASVGISLCPEHGRELPVLQERADRAMYVAKSKGRNQCVIFSPDMVGQEKRMERVARDLYKALSRNEFKLHFQPLVTSDGDFVEFEALLRWTHPVYGDIPPSDFIHIAERSGLMIAIGDWVLAEACRQCLAWQQNGEAPVRVAVNISPVQFEQDDFAERVSAIILESGINPSLLTLELTEGVLVRDLQTARRHIGTLRSAGVRIALDDFGTGYSSLSYLTALPADTIKLDRSFLGREIGKSSAVIESIIELAHRLGLRVIAEGVETTAQRDRLLELNCDEMQGFYFSRPLPAESVMEVINSRRALASAQAELVL